MKKYALAAAVAAVALGGSAVKADFQYNLIYNNNVPAFGAFPGGDSWTLQVKNDGANGTGSNLALASVTALSLNSNGTANQSGVFYIRTWNGTSYDTVTSANNNQADFMNQGVTGRPGPSLSYVNFGTTAAGGTYPAENSTTYTDLQSVPWMSNTTVPNFATGTQGYGGNFNVTLSTAGASSNAGVADTNFTTLAQAVVPHGQQVTFDMLLSSETGYGIAKVLAAFPADTNFDGVVNFTDFANLAAHYNHAATWSGGDFNGDGVVNFTDFALLAANYNKGLTVPPSLVSALASADAVAVPEPGILGLAGMGGMLLLARRRRPA